MLESLQLGMSAAALRLHQGENGFSHVNALHGIDG